MLIRTVLFDLYETLVYRVTDDEGAFRDACGAALWPLYEDLARAHKCDVNALAHLLDTEITQESSAARHANDHREVGGMAIIRRALATLDLTASEEWITQYLEREYQVDCDFHQPAPDASKVLTALRDQGYRLGLVTNMMMPPYLFMPALEQFGLLGYFDALAVSSNIGWRKPSKIIFEHILQSLKVEASSTVMVGDLLEVDILGAQQIGCWTIHTRQFRQEQKNNIQPNATITCLTDILTLLHDGVFDETK